ncbi:serine protease [Gigaspora margarita]|uniref:Serine protease n=1 Tax=Gigaspora margarita TaxID=4874 RepID=A0A8H4ELY7_GIGMA|nr:serine protease [Gigaspora margarita]
MKRQTTIKRQTYVTEVLCGDGLITKERILCSAGFFAKDLNDPSTIYVVTAGHCYRENLTNYFFYFPWGPNRTTVLIGRMAKYSIKNYDYGLVYFRGITPKPIKAIPIVRNTDSNICKELIIHDTTQVSNHGVHLCKSGHESHATCGYVKGFNGIYINEVAFATDLIITDTPAEGGDSGGPAYFYENLCSVSLNGIITAGTKGILTILPLEIILRDANIEPIIIS